MLTALRKTDFQKILAWEVEKRGELFLCPLCGQDVFLKKGLVKVPHFAHKPPMICTVASYESETHCEIKTDIYQRLITLSDVSKCEMERSLITVRPDISFYYKNIPVAVEVQISNLPLQTVIHRTKEYARLGIYLLWISPFTPSLTADKYAPKLWERWLHAAYFGRVYYYTTHLHVAPVRFENYMISVEATDFGGGYNKNSKRYRTPKTEKSIVLPEAFKPLDRAAWKSKNISIPACKLFVGG